MIPDCAYCGRPDGKTAVTSPRVCIQCYRKLYRAGRGQVFGKTRQEARFTSREAVRALCSIRGGCWIWPTPIPSTGYGPHRDVYRALVGDIPRGISLDHTCHNVDLTCPGGDGCWHRACVNPDHLEPVTHKENIYRSRWTLAFINGTKTHCPKGHEYTPENTYVYQRQGTRMRSCRACNLERSRIRYARRKQLSAK